MRGAAHFSPASSYSPLANRSAAPQQKQSEAGHKEQDVGTAGVGQPWAAVAPASCCSASRSGSCCASSLNAGFCSASESPLYPSSVVPPASSPFPLFLRRLKELERLTDFFCLDSCSLASS